MRLAPAAWSLILWTGAGVVPVAAQTDAPADGPAVLVVLKPGESRETHLIWDRGTGRAPAFLINGNPQLSEGDRNRLADVPEYRSGGLVAEYDEARSAAIRRLVQPTGPTLVAAVRVSASADAGPGVTKVYIHNVSGTGRTMLLRGEIRVVVARE